ncbi:hypothetical protein AVEN_219408-1 [Araneus ventricosus]|uniref:Uncharacterized protein n=1 Tax=Araneus ventricosus TaxID=182803 RepID=A0A4Y2JKN1_ARAVE|nr:hypothetical protein AVEN_219408-1 [Araneus ventricosus]
MNSLFLSLADHADHELLMLPPLVNEATLRICRTGEKVPDSNDFLWTQKTLNGGYLFGPIIHHCCLLIDRQTTWMLPLQCSWLRTREKASVLIQITLDSKCLWSSGYFFGLI